VSRIFIYKEQVGRELQGIDAMRLEGEGPSGRAHRSLAQPSRPGQRATAPVCGIGTAGRQRDGDGSSAPRLAETPH
jgi:hypothetical protein